MEPLLNTLLLGGLPLVGVFGGLAWSGQREKRQRREDQMKADVLAQRLAIADFLSKMHALYETWYLHPHKYPIYTGDIGDTITTIIDTNKKRTQFYRESNTAMDILELNLHHQTVLTGLSEIRSLICSEHIEYMEISRQWINMVVEHSNDGGSSHIVAPEILDNAPFANSLSDALSKLVITARDNLQLPT